MDREVLKLMAHIDQTRADVRTAIERLPSDDLVELFRDCARGCLVSMDEPLQQLVGMLAAMAIYDFCLSHEVEADGSQAGPMCPHCGEDDIDRLVWLDDEKVRCDSCGTIYDPDQPDAEA
jgi:predicted RNA-binding Zn-ribbon protein involved in translation (DUF1610 family)